MQSAPHPQPRPERSRAGQAVETLEVYLLTSGLALGNTAGADGARGGFDLTMSVVRPTLGNGAAYLDVGLLDASNATRPASATRIELARKTDLRFMVGLRAGAFHRSFQAADESWVELNFALSSIAQRGSVALVQARGGLSAARRGAPTHGPARCCAGGSTAIQSSAFSRRHAVERARWCSPRSASCPSSAPVRATWV